MRKIQPRLIFLLFSALCVAAVPLLPRSKSKNQEFVIDANNPFVYVRFDHIGPGAPRSEDEPSTRIWLRLVNNCRIPIVVRANGVPDESPKEEIGLEYDVVANRTVHPLASWSGYAKPRLPQKTEPVPVVTQKESQAEASEVPRGYMEEVASTIVVDPGAEILFSMPVTHLSERWHVEVPFYFDLPEGKGKSPGGMVRPSDPVMAVHYTLWDLPSKFRAEIPKAE